MESDTRDRRARQGVVNAPNFANRTLYFGDNLGFLRGMNDGCIDLIATDPPFNTGRNRSSTAGSYEDNWKWLKEGERLPDQWSWESAVHEHWLEEVRDYKESLYHAIEAIRNSHSEGMAAFVCFLSVRLLEMHRILKPTGSIFLHCDSTANAYIRIAMDAVFGRRNLVNEIVWRKYAGRAGRESAPCSQSQHEGVRQWAHHKPTAWSLLVLRSSEATSVSTTT